jgi:hypothetical protein
MLATGRTAPPFCLPGVDGGRARVFRLGECLTSGPALVAFVPSDAGSGRRAPARVARALSWFDLTEGVSPLVVTNEALSSHRDRSAGAVDGAPRLGDGEESVGPSYGVDYDGETVTVYLVDRSRTVRARWRSAPFEELDLSAVNETAREIADPTPTVRS